MLLRFGDFSVFAILRVCDFAIFAILMHQNVFFYLSSTYNTNKDILVTFLT